MLDAAMTNDESEWGFCAGGGEHVLDGMGMERHDAVEFRASAEGIRCDVNCQCGRPCFVALGREDVVACMAMALGGATATWLPAPETPEPNRGTSVAGLVVTPPHRRYYGDEVSFCSISFRCNRCSPYDERDAPIPHSVVKRAFFAAARERTLVDADVLASLREAAWRSVPGRLGRWSRAAAAAPGRLARWSEGWFERRLAAASKRTVEQEFTRTVLGHIDRAVVQHIDRAVARAVEQEIAAERAAEAAAKR